MSKQSWHYIDAENNKQGPIEAKQLQTLVSNGTIIHDTLVWTEELGADWIPARKVSGLFVNDANGLNPPPQPITQPVPITQTQAPASTQTAAQLTTNPLLQASQTAAIAQHAAQQPNQAVPGQDPNPYQAPVSDPHLAGIYPATITKGGSLGLWIMLNIIGIALILLGGSLTGKIPDQPMIGLITLGVGFISITVAAIMLYVYIYRAWKALQPGGATVSPGLAVGLLFVPLFNIYWIFRALGGLPKQWNNITASYENTKNAPKLTIGAFVCFLLLPIIGQIIWLAQITKGLNFMQGLYFQQQTNPSGAIGDILKVPNTLR